jgi:RNA polymerase sigma factor (sigma-70 family)
MWSSAWGFWSSSSSTCWFDVEPYCSLLCRRNLWRPDFRPPAAVASFALAIRPTRASTALEELCRDYWFPLYAFVRRHALSPHEAEDIVQGFLADLIVRGDMASMDQSKGRFRSFLRAACEHYLANRRDHDRAAKRGGGVTIVSINRLDAENRYDREPAHELTAERLFERQWALTVLSRVLERLEDEAVQADKGMLFARLRPVLQGDELAPSYATIGAELGMCDGAVRVAAHRLRARCRELLRENVGRTTDEPTAIDSEIADLPATLASH